MDFFTSTPLAKSAEEQHSECVAWVKESAKKNSRIRTLIAAMEERGCPIRVGANIICEPCANSGIYGGFDAETAEMVVCQNAVRSKQKVEEILAHELVHAYDHCRAHVNWSYLPHWACSEIRAAALSGECSLTLSKFLTAGGGVKPWRIRMGGVDCARRHAIRSIRSLRQDMDPKKIEEAVDGVFTPCYLDSDPFDAIPPLNRSQHGPHT